MQHGKLSLLLAKETSKMFGSTLTLSKWVTKLFNKQVIKIDFKSCYDPLIKKEKKKIRKRR